MKKELITRTLTISDYNNHQLMNICGEHHNNIKELERAFNVTIHHRADTFQIKGANLAEVENAYLILERMIQMSDKLDIDEKQLELLLQSNHTIESNINSHLPIKILNDEQANFINAIDNHDITFGTGPSGTGKTFLSVACAVDALRKKTCKKIILVRPAIEAGEKIGYLPGDMTEKINPYLQPLYDALYEIMGTEQVDKLLQNKTIEINLLAFMRGRTFKHSFVIIDEAQNCTKSQLKMALTRLGYKSKMVIVGDASQSDLNDGESGFLQAQDYLKDISEIAFNHFTHQAVVRHKLVKKIVEAYEKHNS